MGQIAAQVGGFLPFSLLFSGSVAMLLISRLMGAQVRKRSKENGVRASPVANRLDFQPFCGPVFLVGRRI